MKLKNIVIVILSVIVLATVLSSSGHAAYKFDRVRITSNLSVEGETALTTVAASSIQLTTGVATNPTHSEGQFYYDDDDKTITLNMNVSDVSLQIGQEMFIRATNKTGVTITNGQVVYVDGAQGNRPTIALACATTEIESDAVIGMMTHDLADSSTGYVTTFGLVRSLTTDAFSEGTILWLSTEAGAFTDVEPTSPDHAIRLGFVITSNTNEGVILLRVEINSELDDLHDVTYPIALADLQMLQYDGTDSRWENTDSWLAYGTMSQDNLETLVTIGATDVDVSIEGFDQSASNLFTFQNGRELVPAKDGWYGVDWTISFNIAGGGANQELEGSVCVNGVRQPQATAHRTVATITDVGNMAGTGAISAEASDIITLNIRNKSDSQNAVIGHANIKLVRLGAK